MSDLKSLRIDEARLKRALLELSKVGGTAKGGLNRLTLSDEDRTARDLFVEWLKEDGLQVSVDEMGNIFGRKEGENPTLHPIVAGSHLDSQPLGGNLDGSYGVISALEVARTLNDHNVQMDRAFEVVSWTNEEGTRFPPPMMGSGVFSGAFTLEYAYSRKDRRGVILGDELEKIGYRGSERCKARDIHAYLELHIEQGPIMEAEEKSIGVVGGIVGMVWLDVDLIGVSNQAGPTPMHLRRDALVAAADMIQSIRNIPLRVGGGLVSTVGHLEVTPNSRNTIPGGVHFTVDFRAARSEHIDHALQLLALEVEHAVKREGVESKVEQVWRIPYTPFSERCIGAIESSVKSLGYSYMPIISGAGHDAKYLADICDTGMIFVPSKGGRSHCEEESTDWKDLKAGCNVLLQSVIRLSSE